MIDVAKRVREMVAEHLGIELEHVTDSAKFVDDLDADSLDTVEVVLMLKDIFDIQITDEAAETIVTVGDAIRFVQSAAMSEGALQM